MDNRVYFIIGDLLACITVGACVGLLCWLLVNPGWNMWLVMLPAMFVGMIVSLFIWIPFSIFFGAMEVMLTTMMSGMVAGMFVGMNSAMLHLSATDAIGEGAFWGLVTIIAMWLLNTLLRGPVNLATENNND